MKKKTKKNILFIIPDSTSVRNYAYSNIISEFNNDVNIHIWSTLDQKVIQKIESLHNVKIFYNKILLPKENFFKFFLREITTYARLVHNSKKVKNETIKRFWKHNNNTFKKAIFYKVSKLFGQCISYSYRMILLIENFFNKLVTHKDISFFKKKLVQDKIDTIFITHQRVAQLYPIVLAAKKIKINVISSIYSWDNMPKARLNIFAEKYLVWSDHMKNEFKIYYPEIHPDKIIVSGTPQFDFYNDKSKIIERDIFAKKYNLDVKKKWILYSGCDSLTSPYDQFYLSDLAEAIYNNGNKYEIIFRRCPADFSDRFDKVIKKYFNLISVIDPIIEKSDSWVDSIPDPEDCTLLVNVVFHCEIAVNVGSSIAHDFSNFNKPTIYIDYDIYLNNNWSIKIINAYQHFRSMPSNNCVVFLKDRKDWFHLVDKVVNNPMEFATDRLLWYKKINKTQNNYNSKKIANILMK